ncbi:MAG TPA: exodeoxyribonuclease VII large subunit, partial [Ilumatobacteraceae bacterium]|nr:exodeoxyribonuclease VII large subunit [Ilumatobacteraceae bacterium]
VRVQGEFAAEMVSSAIRQLGRRDDIDVVVVIRGGGARTELAVFDDESIAVAIATSVVPVFTGLGHEIDRSIADEVAHTAFKTPTACAAHLVAAVDEYAAIADNAWKAIEVRVARHLERANQGLVDRGVAARGHADRPWRAPSA